MLTAVTFVLHTLVVLYLGFMVMDFYREAKRNGLLMWRFTYCFAALFLTFLWVWVGYFEDLTNFLPEINLRRLTIHYRLIPYSALLASLVAVRRGLRVRRP